MHECAQKGHKLHYSKSNYVKSHKEYIKVRRKAPKEKEIKVPNNCQKFNKTAYKRQT